MNAPLPESQEQISQRPQARGVLARGGFTPLLARLWHFMGWIWGTVIIGGGFVSLLISLVTMGTRDLRQFDPRTWAITHLLLASPLATALVFIAATLLTFACYLADRHVRREQHEQRQAHQEALVHIGRGVRQLLEQAQANPTRNPEPPAPASPTPAVPAPPLWTVPYRRNLFFTGRRDLITMLHDRLTTTGAAALTQALAISGLGGIGKTQIAVEYAYRYRGHYQAIFWVAAASRETLVADFVALAHRLELPERMLEDQYLIVAAVKRWLEGHPGWLLILDNADELDLLSDFLPVGESGSLLLTTRAQATGSTAPSISVEQMSKEEGSVLLLRRAKVLPAAGTLDQAAPEVRDLAAAIVRELDGLPLALDQAGAYIEETACGLASYLELYCSHRRELLRRRSAGRSDHPEPVATTWRLSFLTVEHASHAAADLLRLCAFLAPDAIPEVIVTEGARVLGEAFGRVATDAFHLNEAVEMLLHYSLVGRNPETRMLTIHRLVQAVLQDAMPVETRKQWKELAVLAVNATFPGLDPPQWTACERWLPHAFACAEWIEQEQMRVPAASHLLRQTGYYMKERA
jgi:NB-ARC domain